MRYDTIRTPFSQMFATALVAGLAVAACDSSSGPTEPPPPPGCQSLSLAPGQHTVLGGPEAVDCVLLPAASAGTEYEVVATSMARTLGFSPMELRIAPNTGVASVETTGGRDRVSPVTSEAGSDRLLMAWRAGQSAWDEELRRRELPLLSRIRDRAAAPSFGLFEVPSVGDTMDFNFSCISQSDFPSAPDSVTGIVREVSARAIVIEDTTVPGSFSAAEYAQIAANFDSPVYDTDVLYFGEPGDIDANERIILLYSGGVNKLSESYSEGFIAGFTCPLDLGFVGGNDAEMFYVMVPDPNGDLTEGVGDGISKEDVLRFTENTVAHEFQHLINAQSGNGGAQDISFNEGLSHIAEEVVGHAFNGFSPGTELGPEELLATPARQEVFRKWYLNNWFNLDQYLQAPPDTAALLNAEDPLDFNTFRMRGAAWSFLRYALDRTTSGTAAEAARTRAFVQSSVADSRDAISSVFGVDFNRLATDWHGMLVMEDRDDVAVDPELALTSYQMRAIYDSSVGAIIRHPAPGGFAIEQVFRSLGSSAAVDAELFSGTGLYLNLSAAQGVGETTVGLVEPVTGEKLDVGVEPRLLIVRTR